ncbi:MAG: hypothetical protein MH252_03425 [Thermosynechococcaceae cyanobacterium MS004]|nr:hypothetical protein [Thermosynechococcaceae cyanobacterium MS004]
MNELNDYYSRKIYALLHSLGAFLSPSPIVLELYSDENLIWSSSQLQNWWEGEGKKAGLIADASDRVNLSQNAQPSESHEIRHPISGQRRTLTATSPSISIEEKVREVWAKIGKNHDLSDSERLKRLFWWCWRYLPEHLSQAEGAQEWLLLPKHGFLPDSSLHGYGSTVSALTGALFPEGCGKGEPKTPYLLILTFSPIQEFIKASRKFLDFWAGSYLLHYLSAKLCWHVAEKLGPDAIITPSLWGQDIIDAFLSVKYRDLYEGQKTPGEKFAQAQSSSRLSTAGFPNVITVLCHDRKSALELGEELHEQLIKIWEKDISHKVRANIKEGVVDFLQNPKNSSVLEGLLSEFQDSNLATELEQFKQGGCWEWNALWDAQIKHTWECYFAAVPLGDPDRAQPLERSKQARDFQGWVEAQNAIAKPRIDLPQEAERAIYETLNVGTWWGSCQGRLGQAIQAIKNTRTWQIPTSPGERSSLSGQFSALHPRFVYRPEFQNGRGVAPASLRLFWRLMAEVFPGVFNGTEKLNAIELTKRLAWKRGGIASELGIVEEATPDNAEIRKEDYEQLIRFPNASSVAAAAFAQENPQKVVDYWKTLSKLIGDSQGLSRNKFELATHRPFQVPKADRALEPFIGRTAGYNGVMFSAKWLAEAMEVKDKETLITLRQLVDQAHQKHGFGSESPHDWWVLILGDGDSMGQYVNGMKLEPYGKYIVEDLVDPSIRAVKGWTELLERTRKRMGPATHVSLNRALLDFSNRLVPYLTEERYCGRVIYSGGDDVLAALPLAEVPDYLLSLRAAWCGGTDPNQEFISEGDYWASKEPIEGIPNRPLFTMGKQARMSLGIVVAHKSVPLPTVLEALWTAEGDRAKKMLGSQKEKDPKSDKDRQGMNDGVDADKKLKEGEEPIPHKDGLCFRVIYGSGNQLEAFLKGHLLEGWRNLMKIGIEKDATSEDTNLDDSSSNAFTPVDFSPIFQRLAEELPRRAVIDTELQLIRKATEVVLARREGEEKKHEPIFEEFSNQLLNWLDQWEVWADKAQKTANGLKTKALGADMEALSYLLRFSAFWIARRHTEKSWGGITSNE